MEYQSDAADNDDEYDVQSDDESVILFQIMFFLLLPHCHKTRLFGHVVCEGNFYLQKPR